MKLLVFAHVPPPHHGQSQMVQYLVDGFRGRPELGIEVVHVDARLSGDLQDVGSARGGKVLQLLRYCGQALVARIRTGVGTLYYIPSPPKRTPLVRDWMVFLLLRPWFRHVVFHWEAAGLGEWLETQARPWERRLSRALLGKPALSVVLAETNRRDAEVLSSRRTSVVHNALKDPCPDFVGDLEPRRRARWTELRERGGEVRVLFLALCSRDKGLLDAMEAVAQANAAAAQGPGPALKFRLTVAGAFPDPGIEQEFREWCGRPGREGMVTHVGFLSGADKDAAWRAADVFLFPTYYANEGQPVSLIEAMAYGVPAVTTRWRGIPEMLPAGYPGLVEPKDPAAQAGALLALATSGVGLELRREYERRFTLDRYLEGMASAIRAIPGRS
ncbi:MAG: glycosyltransferase family 4 protein [Verrucomicrobiales bacterium]|nr:glycosyltransferase family 4 protein [Verrucomicrobiales bacterium]